MNNHNAQISARKYFYNIEINKLIIVPVIVLIILTMLEQIQNSYIDDPFTYTDLVLAKLLKNDSITSEPFSIDGYWQKDGNFRHTRLAPSILLLSLEYVTNISSSILITVFYLGNIFIPILMFTLVYKLTRSSIIASLSSIYTIFSLPHTDFGHATLGFICYLIIIILFFNIIKYKVNKWLIFPFGLIFLSLLMTYYIAEVFTILFFGYSCLLLYIYYMSRRNNININRAGQYNIIRITMIYFIMFIIIYLAFDSSTIKTYISSRGASLETLQEKLFNYFNVVMNLFTDVNEGNENAVSSLVYENRLIPSLIFVKNIILLFSIFIPLGIWFSERSARKPQESNFTLPMVKYILVFSITSFLISITEILIYGSIGGTLGIRHLGFIYGVSIFFLLMVRQSTIKILVIILLLTLLFLSISIYYLKINDNYYTYYKGKNYKDLYNNMTEWLFTTNNNGNVMTSHQLSAFIFSKSVDYNLHDKIRINPLDKKSYFLLQRLELCNDISVGKNTLVIPTAITNKPLFGELWQTRKEGKIINALAPSPEIIKSINTYSCINKIYNDNNSLIYINKIDIFR
ncbi:MAG: hypothetical protein QXK74_08670 [Candidatus Nitrosocaldaceae archaeon]